MVIYLVITELIIKLAINRSRANHPISSGFSMWLVANAMPHIKVLIRVSTNIIGISVAFTKFMMLPKKPNPEPSTLASASMSISTSVSKSKIPIQLMIQYSFCNIAFE